MASPAEPPQPLTPPAEPSSQAIPSLAGLKPLQTTSKTANSSSLSQPATSFNDDGSSKRPRDHRLIHLLLASHGVAAYQERVPLQLMDFAYRYTSSVLADAVHLQNEGYHEADTPATSRRGAAKSHTRPDDGDISLAALRIAISSRLNHQFQANLPKEFLKSLAEDRNRIGLGAGLRDPEKSGPTVGGVKLPHERYCLTGVGWGLKEEWDSDGEESADANDEDPELSNAMQLDGADEAEDDEGGATMEDVFGSNDAVGDEDHEMKDS